MKILDCLIKNMTIIAPYSPLLYTIPKTNLYFSDSSGKWIPLPEWGNFFIDIGRRVAECEMRNNKLVIALAIPSRFLAAALTGLGIVLTNAKHSNDRSDINNDWKRLCNLPKGTPVYYVKNGKRLTGIYEGVDSNYNRLRIRVEDRNSGGLTHLVLQTEANSIRVAEQIKKLPKRQKGRQLPTYSKFLESMIGSNNAEIFSTISLQECVFIGNYNILQDEITNLKFACQSESTAQKGHLQDILTVKSFLTIQGQSYHSEVLSATGRNQNQITNETVPPVVIFDGATGFIKYRDNCRKSHWIILLDRTENHFQEAADMINQDYSYRVDGKGMMDVVSIPAGIELVDYQENLA